MSDIDRVLGIPSWDGKEIREAVLLSGGYVNDVYGVDTNDGGRYVVKVLRHDNYPSANKNAETEWLLDAAGVEHSRTVFTFGRSETFPHGAFVQEFITGSSGREVMERSAADKVVLLRQAGAIIKKVHRTTQSGFKYPINEFTHDGVRPNGEAYTFETMMSGYYDEELWRLVASERLPKELVREALLQIRNLLKEIDFPIRPVLAHSDCHPQNCILKPNGDVVYIDWDNAQWTSSVADLAWISYWDTDGSMVVPFREGYGDIEYSQQQFELLERIFHLKISMDLIRFFTRISPYEDGFQTAVGRLADFVEMKRN